MPTIKIGNNPKKINSTSRSYTVSATMSCRLKEPCSMQAPVFKVQGLTKGQLFNYCEFESRYYWVDDVIYLTNNIQEIHCRLDVLATYKTDIGNTYAYIEYGDAAHWQRDIDDPRFSPEFEVGRGHYTSQHMFYDVDAGTYIQIENRLGFMTVVFTVWDGNDGVLRTYATTPGAFVSLVASLSNAVEPTMISSSTTWTDLDFAEFFSMIVSALCGQGSWCDNLVSAKLIPLSFLNVYDGKYSGQPSVIHFGGVTATVTSLNIEDLGIYGNIESGHYQIGIPWDAASDSTQDGNDFMRNSRWVSLQVYAAGQYHNIDATPLRNQLHVYVYWSLDTFSGEWNIRIVEGDTQEHGGPTTRDDLSTTLVSFNGTMASDIKSWTGSGIANGAAVSGLITGILSNLVHSAASNVNQAYMTSNTEATKENNTDDKDGVEQSAIAGGILNTTSGVFGTFPHSMLSASTPSGAGSLGIGNLFLTNSDKVGYIYIIGKQWVCTDWGYYGHGSPSLFPNCFCDEYGYPCHRIGRIGDYSGYVSCVGASVKNSKASPHNLSTINNFLNTGFYYE